MKVTIKDLAKLLSVAPSTISRALNDHPDISEKVKDRVKSVAARFNYTPNLHARYFRKKNTGLIALILPEFNRFFIPDLMEGVEKAVEDKNFSLIIFETHNDYLREVEIIKHCLSWVVEGVLISLSDSTTHLSHLEILKNAGISIVLVDRILEGSSYASVTIDDEKAAYEATLGLINAGRKKIIGLFGTPGLNITSARVSGFRKAIAEKRLTKSGPMFLQQSLSTDLPGDISRFLRAHRDFDGMFIMSDELMAHTYRELQDHRDQYPEHYGIVSISDGSLPYYLTPRISHMLHSGYDVGKTAGEKLINLISNENQVDIQTRLLTKLVDLGSL